MAMKITARMEQNIALAVLALLAVGSLVVLRPFFSAVLMAAVLCFSTWPIYRRVLACCRNRRTIAALVMTVALVLVLLVPFLVIGFSLADNVKHVAAGVRGMLESGPPAPPEWVRGVPRAGPWLAANWEEWAGDSARVIRELKRFIEPATGWLLRASLAILRGLADMAIGVFIAFFLFRDGAAAAERLEGAARRLAGSRGMHLLSVAGATVRGVVYGILGTALAQAITAGIGFGIAGVPNAAFLALVIFFMSIVPVGPPLVWIPTAIWAFQNRSPGWGIFLVVWGLLISTVDNVVKPMLISQGSRAPFAQVFLGILGGALAFGFIGVFIGPTLLAVTARLIEEWSATGRAKESTEKADSGDEPVPAAAGSAPAGAGEGGAT